MRGAFDLQRSLERAERRLGGAAGTRRPRSDRGRPRLKAPVLTALAACLGGQERPPVRDIRRHLEGVCRGTGCAPPARATIYQLMATLPARSYASADLPPAVRETLYNLADEAIVPGHQLAFHCLNYGGLEAACFAAGMPWLALYQAATMRGWRPRSRGLLEAILRARGIR